jgi:hypothetical protein
MAQNGEHKAARAEFLRQAGEAFDRMMVEDQEQMITFEQLEDRALQVGGKLERWLMEQSLAEKARKKDNAAAPCCPKGHKLLQSASVKERQVRARMGPVTVRRVEAYCPVCRKAFFPGGPATQAGS